MFLALYRLPIDECALGRLQVLDRELRSAGEALLLGVSGLGVVRGFEDTYGMALLHGVNRYRKVFSRDGLVGYDKLASWARALDQVLCCREEEPHPLTMSVQSGTVFPGGARADGLV